MNKLIQILYKLQNAVDSVLIKLISALLSSMKAMTPGWVKRNYQKSLEWIRNQKINVQNKRLQLKQFILDKKQKLVEIKTLAQSKIQLLKEIDYANKFIEFKITFHTFRQNHSLKELVTAGLVLLLIPLKKFYEYLASLITISANQFTLIAVLSTVGTVAGVNVYKISREIKNKEMVRRSPASIEKQTPAIVRPNYYKEEQRQFEIGDLKLPLYMKTANGTRSLTLDFKVTTSSRRTLQWLFDNEHKVRDWLLLHFEPIEADFPLLPEGREIVKDKIINELNLYLQHQHVEGKIISLQIINVLGNQ
jgi:hypothetical protein